MNRGQRAKELLADPLLTEALETIRNATIEAWKTTSDANLREECWYTLQGLERFVNTLEIHIANAEVDEHYLSRSN